jgi:type IV secretory pathway TrbF-like protein
MAEATNGVASGSDGAGENVWNRAFGLTSDGLLGHLRGKTPAELLTIIERANAGFAETQRRDGNAVWHAWSWMRAFYVALALWVVTALVGLWLYAHARDVDPWVQTVVYSQDGQFVSVGIPVKLLEYTPEEGQWVDMLEEWVHKRYWRTEEVSGVRARADWDWLARHTCGAASKQLEDDERREQPFVASKRVTSVKVRSTTKTSTPQTFDVLWDETTVAEGRKEKASHTTTFQVGRFKPKTKDDLAGNRLALCVTSYDERKHS